MIDIDGRVRHSLANHASDAPDGADLLAAVHRRAHRSTVRRRLVLGGTAAVVAAAVAVPVTGLIGGARDAVSPAPVGAATRDSVVFAPGRALTISFPLTPEWLPPGTTAYVRRGGADPYLELNAAEGLQVFAVFVGSRPSPEEIPADRQRPGGAKPVQIGGRQGIVYDGGPGTDLLYLAFERRPGQHVFIQYRNPPGTEADLKRIAEGLVDRPLTQQPRFGFEQLPRGYVLAHVGGSSVGFRPVAGGEESRAVLVELIPARDSRRLTTGERVTVAGKSGLVSDVGGRQRLELQLGDDRFLAVEVPGGVSREGLLRFVAGITVPADVPPGS